MLRLAVVIAVLALAYCQPAPQQTRPESKPEPQPRIGEEPLETATIGGEEVQTLPEVKAPPPGETHDPTTRPCGWSSAWVRPEIPNPFLAGVGGTPMPTKVADADILLPVDTVGRSGEMVGEIVIDPDGNVMEVTIVKAFEPRWPEAEDAFMAAARQWKYEPPRMGRVSISLCTTIIIRP